MKAPLFTLSVVANVVLAAVLLSPSAASALRLPGLQKRTQDAAAPKPTYGARFAAAKPGAPAAGTSSAWSSLPADPRDFVAQLRAAGLSETLIASMLAGRLNEQVSARRRELQAAFPPAPYWSDAYTPSYFDDPRYTAEIRAMTEANTKLIRELFGEDALPQDAYTKARERLRYGALPSDRIDAINQIAADYSEMSSAVRSKSYGIPLQEDGEKLLFLEKSKDDDIRAMLSPKEYEDYQYRSSNTGNTMRRNLSLFEPTEDEFRALFALQFAFDQKYNIEVGAGDALMNERNAAQKQLLEDLKAALEPARAAEYERATDSRFRTASQLVARLNLPRENAIAVWQTQKDVQQRITEINRDPTLTQEARLGRLAALQAEAESRVSSALGGQRGLEAYKASDGQWMQFIVPPTAPAR